MPQTQFMEPLEDTSPKMDDVLSVGEDLPFQRRWWRFERFIWILFSLILLADLLGVFGRGYFSKAELTSLDKTLNVKYERTERASTPSIMTIRFGPAAVHNGQVQLFVSETIIKELGNQRISPQPAASILGDRGVTYSFPTTGTSPIVEFALEPSFPGVHRFELQVPGFEAVHGRVIVVP